MLFKILKLAGLDVPAQIAVARTEIELRAKEAADYAKQATVTATFAAAFAAFAAFLFVVAAGVGLFALYSVIAEHFGVYAGLGTVAGLLIAAASVLLFAAIAKAKALSNLRIVRQPSLVRSPPHPQRPLLEHLAQPNRRPIYSSRWRSLSRSTLDFPRFEIRFSTSSWEV
jgi:hypothetical protein